MAKRNFAILSLLLVGGMIAANPANSQAPLFDEGCAALNDAVRRALLSDLVLDENYPGDYYGTGLGGLQSCSNTAAAVSTAFRSSLSQMNIAIRWNLTQPDGGITCVDHNISRCYPFPDPMRPAMPPPDLALIHNNWQSVRDGVMLHMPWGAASNMSYFDATSLAGSLTPVNAGPLNVGMGSIGGFY